MTRPLRAALVLLLGWPPAAFASQATLSASAQSATIAERIELRVVVRADAGVEDIAVEAPAGDYEVIARARRPVTRGPDGATFEEIITIAFFRTGDFTVGPFTVRLRARQGEAGSEQTGRLAVHVRSLLGENDKDIKPLKDLLPLRGDPRRLLRFAGLALLLLLLAAVALLAWKRGRGRRQALAEPLPPPEVELEMSAQELRRRNLPQAGEFRLFYIALAGMLKRFVQRAYAFNAEDCTSAETVAQLRRGEGDGEVVARLEALFGQADLVKFARQVPAREAVEGVWPALASIIAVHKGRREAAQAQTHDQAGR